MNQEEFLGSEIEHKSLIPSDVIDRALGVAIKQLVSRGEPLIVLNGEKVEVLNPSDTEYWRISEEEAKRTSQALPENDNLQ